MERGKQQLQYQMWLIHQGPYGASASVYVIDKQVLCSPIASLNLAVNFLRCGHLPLANSNKTSEKLCTASLLSFHICPVD